jgi:hypothetical protein
VQVVSWVCHERIVHYIDGTASLPLSWHHCLTRSDILSDVPSVLGRDGSHMEPSLGCMVGGPRQWIAVGHLCEASHCCDGGKHASCQDWLFEYVPSILAPFSVFSAVKSSVTACYLFCTDIDSLHCIIFSSVIQRPLVAELWKFTRVGKPNWMSAVLVHTGMWDCFSESWGFLFQNDFL